jgi:hypothetical protein
MRNRYQREQFVSFIVTFLGICTVGYAGYVFAKAIVYFLSGEHFFDS